MSVNQVGLKKILDHPDKDEIISKLIIGISPSDINEWLVVKYTNVSESKFVISEKAIKVFKDNYLDLYTYIKEDLLKTKQSSMSLNDKAVLSVKGNSNYKNAMIQLANNELDIKKMIVNMVCAIETRAGQVFDSIQEDPDNMKKDRILIEYFDTLGSTLERYHKLVIAPPENTVTHNVTLTVVDQHISVFQEVIRDILSKIDTETALQFMDSFNEKMSKLKNPTEAGFSPVETRFSEVKLLNESLNKKLNESDDA